MKDSINNNIYKTSLAKCLSIFSGGMSLAVCILVLTNKLLFASGTDYIVELALIFFTIVIGFKAKSGGLATALILLPLLPGLNTQLEALSGLSVLHKSINGLELVSGFVIGAVIQALTLPKSETTKLTVPWQFGVLVLVLLLSTSLGVARNLWQSASIPSVSGLIYNLLRFNQQGWHEDYRPLTDLVSYLVAIAWLTVLIPLLQSSENRSQKVFRPIIAGLIISGLFGILQVATGWGLPGDRSDRVIGIAAKGFEPDIHAYAGHILLGTLGLLGYLFYQTKSQLEKNIVGLTILISWLALIASKSRSSLLIALVVSLPIYSVWLWRKNKKICISLFLGTGALVGTAIYIRYFYNHPPWFLEYLRNLSQYEVFNRAFGQRADMYIAAVRMFYAFPLLGLGFGDYYRMSADIGFSHSSIYSFLKGENAHNYFLQTLAETGIVGSLVLLNILIRPILRRDNRKQKIIAYIGFAGLCAGNIFAHSFLVRENLFLALSLIALAYAWDQADRENISKNEKVKNENVKVKKEYIFEGKLIGTLIIVTIVLSAKEVIDSFSKYPYKYGSVCFEPRPEAEDHWLSGLYQTTVPAGAAGVSINFSAQGKIKNSDPVKITVSLKVPGQGVVVSAEQKLLEMEPSHLYLKFPERLSENNQIIQMEIKTDRCFTPKNLGYSTDIRRLGVKLEKPGVVFK